MAAKKKSSKKRVRPGIQNAVRVQIFRRGVEKLCGRPNFEANLRWWLGELERRIRRICEIDEPPGSYYCVDVAVPNPMPGQPDCLQEVCYNELGDEISRGPVRCPPVVEGPERE